MFGEIKKLSFGEISFPGWKVFAVKDFPQHLFGGNTPQRIKNQSEFLASSFIAETPVIS